VADDKNILRSLLQQIVWSILEESVVFCILIIPHIAQKGAERMDKGAGELAREGLGRVRYISAGRVFDNKGRCVTIEHNFLGQTGLTESLY
jgi:hypothetical protein